MKTTEEYKYFNVPIQLLKNFIPNTNKVLEDIVYYSLYRMSLNYSKGDAAEKIASAKNFFGFYTKLDNQEIHERGKKLYHKFPEKSPMVGIKTDIILDFKNPKTEFQKVCLLGFLALKSILQNKPYCKIDNKFWLSRMDGNPKSVNIESVSESILKFSSLYQTRKIKHELVFNWNLKTYAYRTRGFYISFKMNLEDLIYEAERRKSSTLKRQLKLREKKARLMAIEKLKTIN